MQSRDDNSLNKSISKIKKSYEMICDANKNSMIPKIYETEGDTFEKLQTELMERINKEFETAIDKLRESLTK